MSDSKQVKQAVANNNTIGKGPKAPHNEMAVELVLEQRWLEDGVWSKATPTLNSVLGADDINALPMDELKPADVEIVRLLQPSLDDQLDRVGSSLTGESIMAELHVDRLAGRIKPFVEGEPIGAYKLRPEPKPAPELRTPERIASDKRQEMLALRAKNDRAMARLLA